MITPVKTLPLDAEQKDVAEFISKYNLLAAPVVDENMVHARHRDRGRRGGLPPADCVEKTQEKNVIHPFVHADHRIS